MDRDKPTKSNHGRSGGGQRSTAEDSGLSFQEEPTGIEGSADQGGSTGSDPGRSSPTAGFTPGPPADGRNPFLTPTTGIIVVVLIALIVAAVWLS